jgi:predicted RNA-binding Zn ribbon-like protein
MHWVEVEGYRMPKPVDGHPALEFCNTLAGWDEPPEQAGEYLHDYDRLAVWTAYAGLVDKRTSNRIRREARDAPAEADAVLIEARQLRTSLYDVLLHPFARTAFRRLATVASQAAGSAVLARNRDGVTHWQLPSDIGLELPVLAVAQSAAGLLCHADRHLVRACPGHQCGWLFLDRHHRRRWCSMASCGNRAKVNAHATRRRALTGR